MSGEHFHWERFSKTLLVGAGGEELRMLGELARYRGHPVTECRDAESALAACKREYYPLIMLDLGATGTDSIALCRALRGTGPEAVSIILALTNGGARETVQRALQSGADDYISKPVDLESVDLRLQVLERRLKEKTDRARTVEGLRGANATAVQRLNDLEARNEQLEHFALNVAHDLKAPIRGIGHLAKWLKEELGVGISDQAWKYFDLIRANVKRITAMIDSLLLYARQGTDERSQQIVVVADLLTETVECLAPPAGFDIQIGSGMPRVRADRTRLGQVFANLMDNAIRHHHNGAGRVEVTASEEPSFYTFTVQDDGPGIKPLYHEEIFELFHSLNPSKDGGSTGAGLALVKRIVEEQGGSVMVESHEGKGAAFTFSWPK